MESWCWSCFSSGRGLVNGTGTLRSVCTLQSSMSPSLTYSRMDLKRRLMCLVLLWNLGSLAMAIAPVLSQKIVIGPDALGITPRSDKLLHPDSFMRCFRSNYVLRFTCRSRHGALLGTAPTDISTIQYKYVSGLWLRVIWINVKACIDVTIYDELFVTSINVKHILSPF